MIEDVELKNVEVSSREEGSVGPITYMGIMRKIRKDGKSL